MLSFTKAEMDALTKKARKANRSREGFCRAILSGAEVKPLPDAEVGTLIRSIYSAGSSLDRLLKICAAQDIDIPELRLAAQESRAASKAVIDAYR